MRSGRKKRATPSSETPGLKDKPAGDAGTADFGSIKEEARQALKDSAKQVGEA
jgi:hypothetical protein